LRGLDKDVLRLVTFSSLDAQDLPEECLAGVAQEYFFKLAEAPLAVISDKISKPDIILKIAQAGREVVLFRMERRSARA
jgi:hypothetical protein